MDEELENLEKSFILDEDMEHENIKELIARTLKFCKIDKNGFVIIDQKTLSKLRIQDKVILVLVARHLASKLQEKLGRDVTIKEEVSSQELAHMLKEKQLVVNARMKELKDKKQALPVTRGTYKIAPYGISPFLKSLEPGEKQ
ncbi:MAG: hypothetical protein KKF65_00775 [Nanoarchaeota archaeon]|nr:hypothetical protein [Nanoarchaeota archaeon]